MPASPSEPTAPAKLARKWSKFQRVVIVGAFGFAALLWIATQFFNAATLPGCDSKRARDTLSDVFQANKISTSRYNEIKTLAENKDEVRCNASLALGEGGNLNVDYRFYWEGSSAKIEYSLKR